MSIIKYTKQGGFHLKTVKKTTTTMETIKSMFREEEKVFDSLTAKNELFLKVLLYLTEHLNHYNEYFQKDNLFYNQVWNKIQEGSVLFAGLGKHPFFLGHVRNQSNSAGIYPSPIGT